MASAADKFAKLSALRPVSPIFPRDFTQAAGEDPPATEEECMLARMIGATVAHTKFGSHLSVRNWHATPEFCSPSDGVIDLLRRTASRTAKSAEVDRRYKNPALAADPYKWLFLDTETTGLAGGTGTYAFLIGIAWWDAGGLQVEQFLMRDFSEEHSVLLQLSERLAERPVLVTFNGKTFDWPLLESRFIMTRCIRVPQLAAHLDLLHPARAVWKLRLGSVKLVELEQQVLDAHRLGWDRADDIPSNMVPQFYFDYLRGGSVAPLAGVVRHNRNDLRGLAALFGKLNELLGADQHSKENDGLDLFGLSRFLHRRGDRVRAESACAAARDVGLPIPFDALAQWELAKMAKRRGEHAQAVAIWEELCKDAHWRVAACEELALFYERKQKDLSAALKYARQAIAQLKKTAFASSEFGKACPEPRKLYSHDAKSGADQRRCEHLTRRIARLESRLHKAAKAQPSLHASR